MRGSLLIDRVKIVELARENNEKSEGKGIPMSRYVLVMLSKLVCRLLLRHTLASTRHALASALTPMCAFALLFVAALPLVAGGAAGAPEDPFAHLSWRNIGPVNMSGRVSDMEGVAGDPRTLYVGAASGGVWKSSDGGVTFAPIFDDQPVASIGDIALAPSNPQVIYVGTGEDNVRNSVSFGNGVYRSLDGGETWQHRGLGDTQQIGRIAVDPHDPDRLFVAAIGPIYAPRDARGVYRSLDGGATWTRVLFLDGEHGGADVEIDPTNPNIVFATLWRFRRKPWAFESGSSQGGVWRSRDGGSTWKKLEQGLPEMLGRVAVKVAPSNPRVVYVIAESNEGILFRSQDRGESFRKVSDDVQLVSRGFYYTDLRIDPRDENRIYALASRLFRSIDGGATFERIARPIHVDFHAMWIDPDDPDRMWVGEDGGIALSEDGGGRWRVPRTLPIAQFYQVFAGNDGPFYTVGGGLQDNGTWFGPSRTRERRGMTVHDWKMMSFGDAYFVVQHPRNHQLYLSESQGGNLMRTDLGAFDQQAVSPQPARNDGGPVGELPYRFSWNAPIIASPHDGTTIYFCGNVVFRSHDFGLTWQVISPDLTSDDPAKQGEAAGPIWTENTTAEYHTTIISFGESPVEKGVLWAGTDDGNLQLSRDDGGHWSKRTVPGVPAFSPVSHVEPSRVVAGRAYVAFDRHMFDDFAPHVFSTEDFGATWTPIVTGLPDPGWVWVVREDPRNSDLLYAGTEVGLWASWDRGGHWQALPLGNLPPVAVHDVLVHPDANDLILGTHGRAIWIFDDATPIQRFADAAGAAVHLFPVRTALHYRTSFTRYGLGDDVWRAPNPPYGALITYALAETVDPEHAASKASDVSASDASASDASAAPPEPGVRLEILDAGGAVVRTLEKLPAERGLNRVAWDLRADPPALRNDEADDGAEFFGPGGGPRVLPGTYTARLEVAGVVEETPIEVALDPALGATREDLEIKHRAASELAGMLDAANRALRALDRVREQLVARRDTDRKLRGKVDGKGGDEQGGDEQGGDGQGGDGQGGDGQGGDGQGGDGQGGDASAVAVERTFDALFEALDRQQRVWVRDDGKPFWSQGPKLAGHLGRFMRELDSAFVRPTEAQRALVESLRGETDQALEDLTIFLQQTVPAANDTLVSAGVPAIAIPEPVAIDR